MRNVLRDSRSMTAPDKCIKLTVPLKAGKAQLKTAFLDKKEDVISGIYYVDVVKIQ